MLAPKIHFLNVYSFFSRGNPTVEVDVYASVDGVVKLIARGVAPSGASTGSNEAHELRDGDAKRFNKKGTSKAVGNVNSKLSPAVTGKKALDLTECDKALCAADGSELKTNVGGNAITAASFAIAEAGARLAEKELFLHFANAFFGEKDLPKKFKLPTPMVNVLNGGKHAGGKLKIQEFMIMPARGIAFKEALRHVTEVYHHLGTILAAKYGASAKNLGDEGGFAPALEKPEDALNAISEAVKAAGYELGKDIFLALDCASSEFYDSETKKYEIQDKKFVTSQELVQYYVQLKEKYPALISIEDGLDEKDYEGWTALTAALGSKDMMIVGDDLYTTNTNLIQKGIEGKWANALLLKVNQIGTITEAMNAAKMLFDVGGQVIVSHRSGESSSSIISDLVVGIRANYIKTGATARGERIAKYNRLLQIEEYLAEHDMLEANNL